MMLVLELGNKALRLLGLYVGIALGAAVVVFVSYEGMIVIDGMVSGITAFITSYGLTKPIDIMIFIIGLIGLFIVGSTINESAGLQGIIGRPPDFLMGAVFGEIGSVFAVIYSVYGEEAHLYFWPSIVMAFLYGAIVFFIVTDGLKTSRLAGAMKRKLKRRRKKRKP